jgi:hypothetical protein
MPPRSLCFERCTVSTIMLCMPMLPYSGNIFSKFARATTSLRTSCSYAATAATNATERPSTLSTYQCGCPFTLRSTPCVKPSVRVNLERLLCSANECKSGFRQPSYSTSEKRLADGRPVKMNRSANLLIRKVRRPLELRRRPRPPWVLHAPRPERLAPVSRCEGHSADRCAPRAAPPAVQPRHQQPSRRRRRRRR